MSALEQKATAKKTTSMRPVHKTYKPGLIGRKVGMSQVFTPEGKAIGVTVIQLGPCYVLSVKTQEKDGYQAVQLGFDPQKSQRLSKSELGQFSKAGVGAFSCVKEIRCNVEELGWGEVGQELGPVGLFTEGQFVDVRGTSIGKGFAGVFKRFDAKGQPSTRGTHEVRRHIGSIGNRKSPGRVFKNKKMPGRMGNENVAMLNLKVMGILPEEKIILVRGSVPGNKGGYVVVSGSQKKGNKAAV